MPTSTRSSAYQPAVLHGIDWDTYTRLLRAFDARHRFRLTYDRGTLEIMSPRWDHERPAYLLGRFVDVLTEELDLPCEPGRTVTLRRRRKQRGLEPDNCYWIGSADRITGKKKLDLRVDPPPDLAIEVDVTKTSVDRMSVYAALRIPEVWRLTAGKVTFHVLKAGVYHIRSKSVCFPGLSSARVTAFINQLGSVGTPVIVRQFRAWVREHLVKRPTEK